MMDMIEDLLTVSKIEAGEFNLHRASVNLAEVLQAAADTFSPQAAAENKTIALECPAHLPANADRPLIQRVTENLIGNALKYTPGEGRVTVIAQPAANRVSITVRDTGPGVPDKYKQHIFDKFIQLPKQETAVRKGVGLGLAFCKLVVEQHGGQIAVTDAPGGGSDFSFWIPTAG
jgi:two-component system phosphate regulon sensor histidine kinase PhoR